MPSKTEEYLALAQRLPGLVQGQVREKVIPDGRVGHVPAVRIHIGSFLHCGGEWLFLRCARCCAAPPGSCR